MKSQFWNLVRDESQHGNDPSHLRRRQTLTLVFAIAVAAIAGACHGQTASFQSSQAALQYDGVTEFSGAALGDALNTGQVTGGAVATRRLVRDARPAYVEIFASLSNFDADADADGWRVDVVLRDHHDQPIVMRANATFELMPRLPSADLKDYVNARSLPIRWSMPLDFDDDSIARVKLPLRRSLEPMLGWPSSPKPTRLNRDLPYGRRSSVYDRRRTFVITELRSSLTKPSHGQLKVRVSVPTEGVFEATAPVIIRPPVLVDTNWPYR